MATTVPDTTTTPNEIAAAREAMGHTLFVLADRVAPKKVIARVKEKARLALTQKVADLKERLNPAEVARRKLNPSSRVIDARGEESGIRDSAARPALSR